MELNKKGVKRGKKIISAKQLYAIVKKDGLVWFQRCSGGNYLVFENNEYGQESFQNAMESIRNDYLFECITE